MLQPWLEYLEILLITVIILLQGDSGGPLLVNSEADDKLEIVGESFVSEEPL